ncbi:hypothetical protein Angca_001031, partial [Angiostrongylus cantonensis]
WNENGNCLVGLLPVVRLFHANSFFENRYGLRWIWESPNGTTHVETHHILTNRK